ncbi:CoA ester lyase [Mameliella alba]|nr:CoA ester lyase [Mameliella alba]MBY6170467.1 CoA ester lyase [Mameliella alba]MBY6175485.1 CoA ester lyase [Mameliella alba]
MVSPDLIRAPLFVPADRPERFAKAAGSGTDAVILDLEDAVAPEAKDKARTLLDCRYTDLPVILRVNAIGTPWHSADIAAACALPFAALMLPKAEDPGTVAALATELPTQMVVIALIETARGLAAARQIAALDRVARLAFGSVDYCADLGCAHQRDALLSARSELVLAARLAGMPPPLDGVTTALQSPGAAEEDARHARSLGMGGKLCIHPRQVPEVLTGFRPTEAEKDWARRVLAAGDGAVAVDGAMVDAPVRLRARSILAAAV